MRLKTMAVLAACAAQVGIGLPSAYASSHREAPFITENPKVDGTDFYMFRSYESGREGYVTLIANYQPLQDAYGGPNYFTLDPDAQYEIHIDNNGDAKEDLTFRFDFDNELANKGAGLKVPAGDKQTAVPLVNIGPISANDRTALNVLETYKVQLVLGAPRRDKDPFDLDFKDKREVKDVLNAADGSSVFTKPTDYIGTKTFADYGRYARAFVYDVDVPNCDGKGRVFVGQRRESFAVNLGTIFDLINAPASVVVGGADRAGRNLVPSTIANENITSIALELPIACVKGKGGDVIAGWTSANVRQVRIINPYASYELPAFEGGAWTQVSRLSAPLVNELVVGIPDKDRFNSSWPREDGQFADYVTNPSLPELIEVLFGSAGVVAPNAFPRADLVAAFLTGVKNVNANGSTAETVRLNTAIPATPKGRQNSLGALGCFVQGVLTLSADGCDPAGFPNGRRPGDDVVDIELRVAMGYLLPLASAPSGQLFFTDAVLQEDAQFDATFPYLVTPRPGAGS
jgi:Domain of unknown function (DUF4331)